MKFCIYLFIKRRVYDSVVSQKQEPKMSKINYYILIGYMISYCLGWYFGLADEVDLDFYYENMGFSSTLFSISINNLMVLFLFFLLGFTIILPTYLFFINGYAHSLGYKIFIKKGNMFGDLLKVGEAPFCCYINGFPDFRQTDGPFYPINL